MTSHSDDERVEALIDQWEANCESGTPVSVEELCADCPELIEKLRLRIQELELFERFGADDLAKNVDEPTLRLGKYRLHSPVARGATSVVYRATCDEDDSNYAVKVLNSERLDGPGAARFRREVSILRRLDHPQIAKIVDSGVSRFGLGVQPYLVMPLIDGEPLDRFVFSRNLALEERVRLLINVANAVQAAHDQGVIHRDLKPANILVTEEFVPIIVDFGLSKLRTDFDESGSFQTSAAFIGTLPFMSPEQTTGSRDEMDERTDVYAMGVIAYQLLAGELPIQTRDCSILDAHFRIRNVVPRSLSSVNRDIPVALSNIVSTALAKESRDRYPCMQDLADDFSRFLRGTPIRAKQPTAIALTVRWIRRHPRLAASIAAFALTLLSATGVSIWFARFARSAQQETQDLLETVTDQKDAAVALEYRFRNLHYQVIQGLVDTRPLVALKQLNDSMLFPEPERLVSWHVLKNRCDHLALSLPADEAVFSEDGRFFLRRYATTTYVTHDANTGERVASFEVLEDDEAILALSANAKWLVSSDLDNHINIRDGLTGKEITYLRAHGAKGFSNAAFTTSGKFLATSGDDQRICIWRTDNWELVAETQLVGIPRPMLIRWSPDESRLACVTTGKGRTLLFDLTLSSRIRTAQRITSGIPVFSPSGDELFALSNDITVSVMSSNTGKLIRNIFRDHREPAVINLSQSGEWLLVASKFAILIKDVQSGSTELEIPGPQARPKAVAFSADSETVYCLTDQKQLLGYSRKQVDELASEVDASEDSGPSVLNGDGRMSARRTGLNSVDIFQAGQQIRRIDLRENSIPPIALSQDGTLLASAFDIREIVFYDIATGEEKQIVHVLHPVVEMHSLFGRNDWLVLCENGHVFRITTESNEIVSLRTQDEENGVCFAVSPIGRFFAMAQRNAPPVLFSAQNGSEAFRIPMPTERIASLAFDQDGTQLAVAKARGEIEIHDLATNQLLQVCRGAQMGSRLMKFSSDGKLLASAHVNQTVIIWDLRSGLEQCRTFLPSPASDLAFSKDTKQLFIGHEDGSVTSLGQRLALDFQK